MDISALPKLPTGLEYRPVTDQLVMCTNCSGGVGRGNVMVGLSRRRKSDTFRRYFPNDEGSLCLNCFNQLCGFIVADHFEKGEAKIDALDKLRASTPSSPLVEAEGEVIDAIQGFIGALGKVLRDTRKFQVEYVIPPTQNMLEDLRGVEKAQDTE